MAGRQPRIGEGQRLAFGRQRCDGSLQELPDAVDGEAGRDLQFDQRPGLGAEGDIGQADHRDAGIAVDRIVVEQADSDARRGRQ